MKRLLGWICLLAFVLAFAVVAIGSTFSWHFSVRDNVVQTARESHLRKDIVDSLTAFILAESKFQRENEFLQEKFIRAGVSQVVSEGWVDGLVGETQAELLWLAERADRTAAADLRNLKSMLLRQLEHLDLRAQGLCNTAIGRDRCRDKARVARLKEAYKTRVTQAIGKIPERLKINSSPTFQPVAKFGISEISRWFFVAVAFFSFMLYAYLYRRPGYRMVQAVGRAVMFGSAFTLLAILGISSLRSGGVLDTVAKELERQSFGAEHGRILAAGIRHFLAEFTWESSWGLCVPMVWLTALGFVTLLFGSWSESSTKRKKMKQKKMNG